MTTAESAVTAETSAESTVACAKGAGTPPSTGASRGATDVPSAVLNEYPSTDPSFGLEDAAPELLYFQASPGEAFQYDQYAFAAGVLTHGSVAGVGNPAIRQMNAVPQRWVPVTS